MKSKLNIPNQFKYISMADRIRNRPPPPPQPKPAAQGTAQNNIIHVRFLPARRRTLPPAA